MTASLPVDIENAAQQADMVLLTDAYPYGSQETFVDLELPYLLERFPRILILPRTYGDGPEARSTPDGVTVATPFFDSNARAHRLIRGLFNSAPLLPLLRRLVSERLYMPPGRIIRWLEAAATARRIVSRPLVRMLAARGADPLWYFYWGAGSAWSIPFLPRDVRVMCRFHGFDVYEDRTENRGCMPFQASIIERLCMGACVSQHGLAHLQRKYRKQAAPLSLERLGVPGMPDAQPSDDGVFRILSCSRIVPVKQLELLAEAIMRLDFPVAWRHLGDGPGRAAIERQVASAPNHVTCVFPGQVDYEEVRRTYRECPIDLFALVSKSEGVPVVIMEALAAGVPVLATAVGGVPELIDDSVGWLLPANADVSTVSEAITDIQRRPDRRAAWAGAARQRWMSLANAETTFKEFATTCAAL